MASHSDAAKTDAISGLAHSEAHYFNRYTTSARLLESMR
jgi:hypothetical protein